MNIKEYNNLFGKLVSANNKEAQCPYCGAENHASSDITICFNCELPFSISEPAKYLIPFGSSEAEVMAAYEKLLEDSKDPLLAYAYGVYLLNISNKIKEGISYEKKGFMEDNSDIENSSKLAYAKARLFFSKAAYLSESYIKAGEASPQHIYAMLVSYLKLGNMRAAAYAYEKLKGMSNAPMLVDYSSMLMSSANKNAKELAKNSTSVLNKFLIFNSFYYLAYARYISKDTKTAEHLLEMLLSIYKDNATLQSLKNDIHLLELSWK
ncbi:MAG: hypothetical protein ACP5RP_00350 [Candidatus Micrarchaeia archaeon]